MKIPRFLSFLLALTLLSASGACGGPATPTSTAVVSTPSPLPAPAVRITSAPDSQSAVSAFLEAWKANDFAAMYGLLDQNSQQTITQEEFIKRYRNAMNALTLSELQYELLGNITSTTTARMTFRVTYKTNSIGDLQREMTANFTLENGQWRLAWEDGLILPELSGGNHLSMAYEPPARGIVFDRNANPLVAQMNVTALGVIPVQILPEQEPTIVSELSRLTGLYPSAILGMYDANRYTDWYTPIGEAPAADVNRFYGRLSGLAGLVMNEYTSRFYYQGGIAPQVLGYVSPIQPDELESYLRQGYSPATRVGRIGLEKWGEQYLAGKTGGALYVVSSDGKPISTLSKKEAQLASSITLTIDKNLQYQTQKAIQGRVGSIVVMERDSGRVLAIASMPDFDPNLFEPDNYNSGTGLGDLLSNTDNPLYNRAIQGQYPLGSVFKVITFAAALESGTYTPETPYDCQYEFTELADRTLYDWTWEHFQSELFATGEGKTQPSGTLTLTGALMRSCNPYFWHIGRDLFLQGRTSAIADMSRGFGLGSLTGIDQIAEEKPGAIINPTTELEATNQAIGQGDVLVTPLQVARFMAAIGNGGTLYRPQLVEKITDPAGNITQVYKADSNASPLPMKPESLAALRFAMREVVKNTRGTAHIRFLNIDIPIFGKTGTAESNIPGSPHAWFAGYTDANRPGKPDIAIAVIAENSGEGSQIAAPIFKRIVEVYFYGQPRSQYPWESNIGITRTPTSPVSPTPGQ